MDTYNMSYEDKKEYNTAYWNYWNRNARLPANEADHDYPDPDDNPRWCSYKSSYTPNITIKSAIEELPRKPAIYTKEWHDLKKEYEAIKLGRDAHLSEIRHDVKIKTKLQLLANCLLIGDKVTIGNCQIDQWNGDNTGIFVGMTNKNSLKIWCLHSSESLTSTDVIISNSIYI